MTVMEYYEAYDREVVQTQGIADVTTMVPAQDWATRFTEMQGMLLLMFPPWALALITWQQKKKELFFFHRPPTPTRSSLK